MLLSSSVPVLAQALQTASAGNNNEVSQTILVTAQNDLQRPTERSDSYTVSKSHSATGLDLSLKETPQSVSVVTRAEMDDYKLNSVNDALADTTGVTVEKVETDRTYYTARGFDIVNFQFDGVGVPLVFGNQNGDLDTAMFDRVEILRGATGLLSSTGNPSATVDFVRKRPTYNFQASGDISYGSWDTRRLDADVSGPLNSADTVAARMVVVDQDGHSYLDRYQPKKTVFYGVVEANLSDKTLLTIGYSNQKNDSNGAMWGALPLYYSNGAPTNFASGTNTSADWSYWNSTTERSFVELSQKLGQGWQWKTTLSDNQLTTNGALFYVYGTPDQSTGNGLFSYPSLYNSDNRQLLFDSNASGKYELGGRQHDLSFGVSWSRSTLNDISHYGQGIGTALTLTSAFNGSYPEPEFNASTNGSSYVEHRRTLYGATRFNLADDLKLLVGANYTQAESSGYAYGVSQLTDSSAVSPYAGLVYDLNKNVSAYASYTAIFNPQYQTDIHGATLDPLKGKNIELGLKGDFLNHKLNASAALFKVKEINAAEQAGYIGSNAYYRGIDAHSEGLELDIAGELAKGLQGSIGYTAMTLKDDEGNNARTYVPKELLRAALTYRLPQSEKLKIGASINWQGQTSYTQTPAISTSQEAYALLDLMAHYDFSKQFSLSANINNVTDKKYIASLYWAQGYYGAPINGSLTANWKF